MQELIGMCLGDKFLAFTNFILAFCIIFHLICEFSHYLYDYFSRKRDTKKLDLHNDLLQSLILRVEKMEKVMSNKKCPLKEEK